MNYWTNLFDSIVTSKQKLLEQEIQSDLCALQLNLNTILESPELIKSIPLNIHGKQIRELPFVPSVLINVKDIIYQQLKN